MRISNELIFNKYYLYDTVFFFYKIIKNSLDLNLGRHFLIPHIKHYFFYEVTKFFCLVFVNNVVGIHILPRIWPKCEISLKLKCFFLKLRTNRAQCLQEINKIL